MMTSSMRIVKSIKLMSGDELDENSEVHQAD